MARSRLLHIVLGLTAAVGVLLALLDWLTHPAAVAAEKAHRPIEVEGKGYVSSRECRSCHPSEYESWHRSYHRTMTTEASPETVKGDFGDVKLPRHGSHVQLTQHGDDYFVDLPAPPGAEGAHDGRITMPIALVTGSHHMQIYWYETGYGRMLGQVPFVYDVLEGRWIPRGAAFLRPHDKPRTGEMGRWNTGCINCHTTQGRPRIGPNGEEPDTHVAEFGIACEACHGPAEQHVAEQRLPFERYPRHLGDSGQEPVPNIVQPAKLDAARASQICSQCHAMLQLVDADASTRWRTEGHSYRPGKKLVDRWLFQPSKRDEDPNNERMIQTMPEYFAGMFWPDGEARVSSREYHGMTDSPCYEGGDFSCMSCHTLHKRADDPRSLDAWAADMLGQDMETNQACLQCHQEYADELETHTRHAPESAGSLCYNCHMPHTAYGLLKGIRSHKVTSPNVKANADAGRPNACNLCHLDKSLQWTADQLAAGWDVQTPPLQMDDATLPAAAGWALVGDAGERALTAWTMGWEPAKAASGRQWMVPLLALLIDDDYQAVRYVASRSLRSYPGYEDVHVDVTAGSTERRRDEMMQRWRMREGTGLAGPQPLFRPSGELDEELVQRLLSERDQTPVHLLE
jgi:hypothetical protein